MLGAHDREPEIGAEIFACQIGQPQRQIGQFRKALDPVGIGDETGRVDDDLAAVEPRVEDLAERFIRAGLPPFGRQHADTDGTVQFTVEKDAECPGVRQVVILIGDALFGGFLHRALTKIGPVPKIVDFFFFFRCLR